MFLSRFPFLGTGDSSKFDDSAGGRINEHKPTLSLQTDKDVYRPGDSVFVTIEICNCPDRDSEDEIAPSILIERLSFELKGLEKLDTQWFATQKRLPGAKGRRGEHIFLDSSTPTIISNQLLSSGATKTYTLRVLLPDVIPPSYRGATIRYLYYIKSTLSGRWMSLENNQVNEESREDLTEVETRVPLQIWVTQKSNGLVEENQGDGIVPTSTIQTDIYWKEMDGDSEWTPANDAYDTGEEDYDGTRDDISSVSSYPLHRRLGSSLSLNSVARSTNKDSSYMENERTRLSVAEVLYDSDSPSPYQQQANTEAGGASLSAEAGTTEPVASEGFIRGKSYNIRVDDQVLLRFSPKNGDSTYYFSDSIGGTLTFFHEKGARRCLEVTVTLETSETISRRFVHPSRKSSPTITKVQSDHHEVVADLVQTSFLFSIPMDGPMSFVTPHVSVQWILRFEFLITPKNVDLTRYEHPLLVERRERSEWILPITVHAPPQRPATARTRSEKLFSLEPLWIRS